MQRDIGPLTLTLKKRNGAQYLTARLVMNGSVWETTAAFPEGSEEEAIYQFEKIETPGDLEALIRAWTSADTWASYQELRDRFGF